MVLGIIYKTTNLVNGKWYIGKYEGTRSGYLGSGTALTHAIRKYGRENFIRETIAECEVGRPLAILEQRIIKETNAVADSMSYNIAEGGTGGHTRYDKIRRKEHCDNISKALIGRVGKPRSKETKEKMSKSRRSRNNQYKIIIDSTIEIITDCLEEFSKSYGISGKSLRYSAKNNIVVKRKFLAIKLERNHGN